MKKINELQLCYSIVFFILFMNFAETKDFSTTMTEIINMISNTYMKALGGLVIIGICIYAYLNRDRLKEIAMTCIIFILCVIGITNASSISNWFF